MSPGGEIDLPGGFAASGVAAGIKASGAPDLGLIVTTSRQPVPTAAVFTQNLAAAAPVHLSRAHLAASGGDGVAIVVNSGCANAATGADGTKAATETVALVASELGIDAGHVLVCSTGVIGHQLPMDAVRRGVPEAVAALGTSPERVDAFAQAILTTDTRTKHHTTRTRGGTSVTGIAKGAAMLAPNMATMLAFLLTDAAATAEQVHDALSSAVDATFNRLSIDGCSSTNDTVIAMAGGAAPSGEAVSTEELTVAFTEVCASLAHQMAADAEGGTKVVRVVVSGAEDDLSALAAARKIADANLVKCSWYGADPNWGRVVSEAATAGIAFDLERVSAGYGPHNVCVGGQAAPYDDDAVRTYLSGSEIEVRCDLGLGDGTGSILSADLTHGYIDENMGLS